MGQAKLFVLEVSHVSAFYEGSEKFDYGMLHVPPCMFTLLTTLKETL